MPDEEDLRTEGVQEAISGCIGRLEEHGIPVVRVAETFSSREALELLHATGRKTWSIRGRLPGRDFTTVS